mmetsp:Transcript_121685/g.289286  ORF Transcript_121685/g.289286 Transcript_121685/m.289286 type:complete len:227 (-) Transcript_121685:661-1341(-)
MDRNQEAHQGRNKAAAQKAEQVQPRKHLPPLCGAGGAGGVGDQQVASVGLRHQMRCTQQTSCYHVAFAQQAAQGRCTACDHADARALYQGTVAAVGCHQTGGGQDAKDLHHVHHKHRCDGFGSGAHPNRQPNLHQHGCRMAAHKGGSHPGEGHSALGVRGLLGPLQGLVRAQLPQRRCGGSLLALHMQVLWGLGQPQEQRQQRCCHQQRPKTQHRPPGAAGQEDSH